MLKESWLAVEPTGEYKIFDEKPIKSNNSHSSYWITSSNNQGLVIHEYNLSQSLYGMTYKDEPINLSLFKI